MVFVQSLQIWLLLLLSCRHVLNKNLNSFAGPFIAFAHRFDVCPSDGSAILHLRNTHFNPAKPFEKQKLKGNATLKWTFDDGAWGHVNLAVRSNNEWKDNAFIFDFPGGGCSALREHIPSFFRIIEKLVPQINDRSTPCKVPPGFYRIENETVSWEFPKFKVMPYGRYRFTVTVGKETRAVKLCMAVDCSVIPKPR